MADTKTAAEKAAEKTAQDAAAAGSSDKVVTYVGTADVREIAAKDWASLGVEDQGIVRWDKSNKYTVPAKDLKPGAVEYCDNGDDGFVVKG